MTQPVEHLKRKREYEEIMERAWTEHELLKNARLHDLMLRRVKKLKVSNN